MTCENREKFQQLLRELFQFECSDLDFGIYRIMNHKRTVIDRFIENDMPAAIAEELKSGVPADQADGARSSEALEALVFNHLHAFFSRYYDDGDFVSKRRYSKRERYAIPYNGEEVHLHWANADQYYVKTGEHFRDYSFTSRGVTVLFQLRTADVEQNNVKGDRRFFLPDSKETVWEAPAGRLVIPFSYRPLTRQEDAAWGRKNQQEAIIAAALTDIPARLENAPRAHAALTAERRREGRSKPVTTLEHHLRQYTRRNTSDFFIHKDLKRFLDRELDFYLKSEALNIDEIMAGGEVRGEGWFQIMRAIRAAGAAIIDFLDQIEDFQKMLWEKRKFVTATQYCIAIGHIDESFYPEIANCEPQWEEWRALFHIDETAENPLDCGDGGNEKRIAFLSSRQTLVLDTRHFDADFVDRVLGGMDDLDDSTDAMLFHSDSFSALHLLLASLARRVECIYIDPPYNTDSSSIIYKNGYKNSSWLTMMHNGILAARALLSKKGVLCCAIDDEEAWRLRAMLQAVFARELGIGLCAYQSSRKEIVGAVLART